MLGLMKPSEGIWTGGMHFLAHGMGYPCCLRCKLRILRLRSGAMLPEGGGVLQFGKVSGFRFSSLTI